MFKFLNGHILLFLLGMYLGGELLGQMGALWLTFYGTARPFFPSTCTILPSPQHYVMVPISPHSQQHLLLPIFFFYSHPGGYKVMSHCDLISISQIANAVGQHFMCFWPFVYLLWKNVYSEINNLMGCLSNNTFKKWNLQNIQILNTLKKYWICFIVFLLKLNGVC